MADFDVKDVLAEREARYGKFAHHAAIAQGLKAVMMASDGWGRLNASQREALEMIQHKIARILNGDPAYGDNWVDVSGYATLVVDELAAADRWLPENNQAEVNGWS